MTAPVYAHQQTGANWVVERAAKIGGAYLADDMGLGKTRTLLLAMQTLQPNRPVVICPAIVRSHWEREAALMGVRLRAVISYEGAVNGGTALQRELDADLLVSDEAHYCKSMDALRTRRVFGMSGYARAPGMRHVLAASGTPMPKNPLELWPALSCFPEVCREFKLSNRAAFKDRYCAVRVLSIRGRRIEKVLPELRNEAEFAELLSRFMLRRTLDDVGIDVPTLDFPLLSLDLQTPWLDPAIAAKAESALLAGINPASHAEFALWRHAAGDAKAPVVAALLADWLADSDEKVVVFAHHRSVLQTLRVALTQKYGVAYIDGDTNPALRDTMIELFQTNPQTRVFLGQNQACMTGITLTAAKHAVLVEPDWTAANNLQLGRRIARIGQVAGHCQAHLVAATGTLDERILRLNQQEIRMHEKAGLYAA